MIKEYNPESFNNDLQNNPEIILIDFYADWCGPCKMMSKYLEEFSATHPDILISKVNAEEHENILEEYNIQGLPTVVCLECTNATPTEIWRNTGLMTVKMLETKIFNDNGTKQN